MSSKAHTEVALLLDQLRYGVSESTLRKIWELIGTALSESDSQYLPEAKTATTSSTDTNVCVAVCRQIGLDGVIALISLSSSCNDSCLELLWKISFQLLSTQDAVVVCLSKHVTDSQKLNAVVERCVNLLNWRDHANLCASICGILANLVRYGPSNMASLCCSYGLIPSIRSCLIDCQQGNILTSYLRLLLTLSDSSTVCIELQRLEVIPVLNRLWTASDRRGTVPHEVIHKLSGEILSNTLHSANETLPALNNSSDESRSVRASIRVHTQNKHISTVVLTPTSSRANLLSTSAEPAAASQPPQQVPHPPQQVPHPPQQVPSSASISTVEAATTSNAASSTDAPASRSPSNSFASLAYLESWQLDDDRMSSDMSVIMSVLYQLKSMYDQYTSSEIPIEMKSRTAEISYGVSANAFRLISSLSKLLLAHVPGDAELCEEIHVIHRMVFGESFTDQSNEAAAPDAESSSQVTFTEVVLLLFQWYIRHQITMVPEQRHKARVEIDSGLILSLLQSTVEVFRRWSLPPTKNSKVEGLDQTWLQFGLLNQRSYIQTMDSLIGRSTGAMFEPIFKDLTGSIYSTAHQFPAEEMYLPPFISSLIFVLQQQHGDDIVPVRAEDAHLRAGLRGYLTKEGGFVKSWLKRWFELKGPVLYYYKERGDSSPKGTVEIKDAEIFDVDTKENCLAIKPRSTERTYFVQADLKNEFLVWRRTLLQTINSYEKHGDKLIAKGGGHITKYDIAQFTLLEPPTFAKFCNSGIQQETFPLNGNSMVFKLGKTSQQFRSVVFKFLHKLGVVYRVTLQVKSVKPVVAAQLLNSLPLDVKFEHELQFFTQQVNELNQLPNSVNAMVDGIHLVLESKHLVKVNSVFSSVQDVSILLSAVFGSEYLFLDLNHYYVYDLQM